MSVCVDRQQHDDTTRPDDDTRPWEGKFLLRRKLSDSGRPSTHPQQASCQINQRSFLRRLFFPSTLSTRATDFCHSPTAKRCSQMRPRCSKGQTHCLRNGWATIQGWILGAWDQAQTAEVWWDPWRFVECVSEMTWDRVENAARSPGQTTSTSLCRGRVQKETRRECVSQWLEDADPYAVGVRA